MSEIESSGSGDTGIGPQEDNADLDKGQDKEPCPCDKKAFEKFNMAGGDLESKMITPLILKPEHPMMERFQAVFKAHLMRQLQSVKEENFVLNSEIKKNQKEREDVGVELYSKQQEVFKQQTMLEECQSEIEEKMRARDEVECSLRTDKNKWKEKMNELNQEKKNETDLNSELNRLSALKKQFEMWENEIDSDLTVSQRIAEKTKADRKMLFEEKRKMDVYLLRLMGEVNRFESELSLLNAEIEMKLEEGDRMNQTLADANADLEALAYEQKRLFRAWNSVVVILSQRDTVYTNVLSELNQCREGFRSLMQEIESFKRTSDEEMRTNEGLSIQFHRLSSELEQSSKSLEKKYDQRRIVEEKIAAISAVAEQTDKDLFRAKVEHRMKDVEYTNRRNELEKLLREKSRAEDEILSLIQDLVTNDKACGQVKKQFDEMRKWTRMKESAMIESENKLSKVLLKIEEEKGVVARNKDILDEMNKELQAKERELKSNEDIIARFPAMLVNKQTEIMTLDKKIEKLMADRGVVRAGQHPLELKVSELEHAVQGLQEKNDSLQSYWLLEQNNSVKISLQRSEQLKEISLLRKQVVILDQRTLKIEAEVEQEQRNELELTKTVGHLQKQLENLNTTLVNRRGYKQNLDKGNFVVQSVYMAALKEAERDIIQLQYDVYQFEKELGELENVVLDIQREMVAWEKKIKLTLETIEEIKKEKQSDGEIGQMKIEIHRMEVRESQLKKAEEKLVNDLELCVLRRETITEVAQVRDRKAARGVSNTKFNMQKKLDEWRNKVRKVQNDIRLAEKEISDTENYHGYLLNGINEKTEHLRQQNESCVRQVKEFEEFQLKKQQNLEMLVRRQKKCKLYNNVKVGKHRLLYRNELVLDNEMQTQRQMNSNLISVVETLVDSFPNHKFWLKKICNTLSAPPS